MNLVEAIWTWYSPGGSSELEQKNVARSLWFQLIDWFVLWLLTRCFSARLSVLEQKSVGKDSWNHPAARFFLRLQSRCFYLLDRQQLTRRTWQKIHGIMKITESSVDCSLDASIPSIHPQLPDSSFDCWLDASLLDRQ
jgi:hypothetical protein